MAGASVIGYGEWGGGAIYIPASASIATVSYYGSATRTGTFLPLYDNGAAVEHAVEDGSAHNIPAACFGIPYLKIIGLGAGAITYSVKG